MFSSAEQDGALSGRDLESLAEAAFFARNGGEVVNSTGDGFFVVFDSAALAGDGDIVASIETLAEAGDILMADPREASLKGFTDP